jgi:hypothetical protein
MPALSGATRFNVEATLNAWLITTVTAITRSAHLPTLPAFVTNWDQVAASMPCFAVTHTPAGMLNDLQGRVVGGGQAGRKALGLMEVSCYTTRNGNPNWNAQLRSMQDLVETAATSTGTVVIYDYQTSASSPTATTYKVNIDDVTETPTESDPNPAIQRRRILIAYSFYFRAN